MNALLFVGKRQGWMQCTSSLKPPTHPPTHLSPQPTQCKATNKPPLIMRYTLDLMGEMSHADHHRYPRYVPPTHPPTHPPIHSSLFSSTTHSPILSPPSLPTHPPTQSIRFIYHSNRLFPLYPRTYSPTHSLIQNSKACGLLLGVLMSCTGLLSSHWKKRLFPPQPPTHPTHFIQPPFLTLSTHPPTYPQ